MPFLPTLPAAPRRRHSKLAAFALVAALVLPARAALAGSVAPTPGNPARSGVATAPAAISLGVSADGAPWSMTPVQTFEHDAGKQIAILNWYEGWQDTLGYGGPGLSLLNSVAATGAVPMISWGPEDSSQGVTQPNYTLATIAAGRYDTYVRQWAQQLAAYGKPVLLRWAWEMNGDWFPWGQNVNGNTPDQYVAAWRHLHDIFAAAGATNVQWVWSPNVLGGQVTQLETLYPGDAYVDWLALDGYNRPMWGWESFTDVFGATYARLTALSGRPVMIAETSSGEAGAGAPSGETKAAWISSALTQEIPTAFPRVRALVWFNVNKAGVESDGYDWRIESSSAAATAFAQAVASPLYSSTLAAAPAGSSPTSSPSASPTASPTAAPTKTAAPATATPTPSPTPAPSAGLLQNGSFESTTGTGQGLFGPWWLDVKSGAAATLHADGTTAAAGSTSARVDVTQTSAYWSVQLYQHIAALTAGTPYTLSFWAKAAAPTALTVAMQQSPAPYTVYAQQTVTLSTAWQQYTLAYTPAATTDPDTLIVFNLGAANGSIWLDGASLTATGSAANAAPVRTATATAAPLQPSASPSPTPSPTAAAPQLRAGNVCATPTLSVYPAGTAVRGANVTLTAATDGCAAPLYRFYAVAPFGAKLMLRDYQPSPTFVWPTGVYWIGSYTLEVDVRAAGATVDQQASASTALTLTAQ